MTKEQYFEMCEMMNTEPVEDDIPVEIRDFPDLVQQAFQIYSLMRDIWEGMSGTYLGKDMSTLFDFFKLYDVEPQEHMFVLNLLKYMDYCRSEVLSQKQKAREASSKKA